MGLPVISTRIAGHSRADRGRASAASSSPPAARTSWPTGSSRCCRSRRSADELGIRGQGGDPARVRRRALGRRSSTSCSPSGCSGRRRAARRRSRRPAPEQGCATLPASAARRSVEAQLVGVDRYREPRSPSSLGDLRLVVVDVLAQGEAPRHQQRAACRPRRQPAPCRRPACATTTSASRIASLSSRSGIARWPAMPSPLTSVSPVCQRTSASGGRISSRRRTSRVKG